MNKEQMNKEQGSERRLNFFSLYCYHTVPIICYMLPVPCSSVQQETSIKI
jgi:hypothetical protein